MTNVRALAVLAAIGASSCTGARPVECTPDSDWWITDVAILPMQLSAGSGETVSISVVLDAPDFATARHMLSIDLATDRGYIAVPSTDAVGSPFWEGAGWSEDTVIDGDVVTWTLTGPSFVPADVPAGSYFLVVSDLNHVCPRAYFTPAVVTPP